MSHDIASTPRWTRFLMTAFAIAALALVYPRGGPGAAAVVLLSVAIATAVAWVVADPADRPWVLLWTLLAITARELLVGAVDVSLLTQGLRWYAPDERVYVGRAFALWQHWVQPAIPLDETDQYLNLWYVHGMAHLYQVFGENVVVVKVVNTLLSVLAALLAYRTMHNLGMPGRRWALVPLLAFPSVAFWSALTLKDSYVIFFLVSSLWTASEFVRGRNAAWLALSLLTLIPLETVRIYMFVTGALALLAIPFALTQWRQRLATGGALLVSIYTLFAIFQPFRDLGTNIFYIPIFVRQTNAEGARSSFVEPKPVIEGEPGQQFQIAVSSGATQQPGTTPRTIQVRPGSVIFVERAGATPPAGADVVSVRPGDILVIAQAPGASPTPKATGPSPSPLLITIVPEAKNTVGLSSEVDPDQTSFEGSLATNIRHLPTGILYTLFAPFPWAATTIEQVATIPEMLLWYVCLALAVVGFAALFRRRDFRYAHGVAAIIGLVLVLSLISANVGTLLRSRAMLVPYVLLLTGVGMEMLLRRYPSLGARWRPDHSRS